MSVLLSLGFSEPEGNNKFCEVTMNQHMKQEPYKLGWLANDNHNNDSNDHNNDNNDRNNNNDNHNHNNDNNNRNDNNNNDINRNK